MRSKNSLKTPGRWGAGGAGLLPAGAPGPSQVGPALRLWVGLASALGRLPMGSLAPWEAEAG